METMTEQGCWTPDEITEMRQEEEEREREEWDAVMRWIERN